MTATMERPKSDLIIPPRESVDFLWYSQQRLRTEKGEPLDFEGRPYLKGIYDCENREIVLKKSAQTGLSTYSVNRALWLGDTRTMTMIYVLPTRDDVNDFSQTRFNTVASHSQVRSRMEVDNVGVKQIGNSFVYFRGTWNEKEATSIPADLLIRDEFDKCKQDVAESYRERLSASKYAGMITLSTPTFSDYGIDIKYKESDMREWFVNCRACGLAQILNESHINYDADRYRCEKCSADLDSKDGQWQATANSRIAGFHPTQFMAPWIRPRTIMDKKVSYKLVKDFFNFVKGETYSGGTETVTREDVMACIKDQISQSGTPAMGIDWGNESWFVVRKPGRIVHYGKVTGDTRTHPAQMMTIADKFPSCKIVADFGYGDGKNKELIEKRPRGSVWMCVYTTDGKHIYPSFKEKEHIVNIDRTRSLQENMSDIKERRLEILRNPAIYEERVGNELKRNVAQDLLIEHYGNLFEKKEQDKSGVMKVSIECKGPDHLAHADNYASLLERRQNAVRPSVTFL